MEDALRFLRDYEIWIYIILGLLAIWQLWKFTLAWQELRAATFGLEREQAQGHLNSAAVLLVLFLLMAKLKGIFLFVLPFFCVLLFIQYIKRRIGGMTGDTIGAISEIAEVSVLFSNLLIVSL